MEKLIDSNELLIAQVIKSYNNTLHEYPTTSSTSSRCIIINALNIPPSGSNHVTIFVKDDDQLAIEMRYLLSEGYVFGINNVSVTSSIHQNRLKDAKLNLMKIMNSLKPQLYDIEKLISDLGIALNIQIDLDPNIHNNKTVKNNINDKLSNLGLECDNIKLFNKHKNMNIFFNSTKHQKETNNVKYKELLNSKDNVFITIDYFETIRNIFRWYYDRHAGGIPDWDELKEIKYNNYISSYIYSIDRIW